MDSIQGLTVDGSVEKEKEVNYGSMVDPFLVEALQNPRHRLTSIDQKKSFLREDTN